MAKFNITVELDWLNCDPEDENQYNLDEEIQQTMVTQILNRINKKVSNNIEAKIKEQIKSITENMERVINDRCNTLMDEFLSKKVVVTDNYGDKIAEHDSVKEMLKEKFDNFITQNVDERGNIVSSCTYGKSKIRIEQMIEQMILKKANDWTQGVVKDTDEKIKKAMNEAARIALCEKIKEKLEI